MSDRHKTLFTHRNAIYIAFCKALKGIGKHPIWRSKVRSNGKCDEGRFLLGIGTQYGSQIAYCVPIDDWDKTSFAETLDIAPDYDEHTPEDVLKRLAEIPWDETPGLIDEVEVEEEEATSPDGTS